VNILIGNGIPINLMNTIKSLYDNTSIVFNKEKKTITETSLVVNQEFTQGCGLSPLLSPFI
jgi:hypothetical protein